MGNYMETCIQKGQVEQTPPQVQTKVEQGKQDYVKPKGTYDMESGKMRVKLVLTKDELDWLLLQLKNKEGKRLDDVLGEIGKSRMNGSSKSVVASWKPSLESIMETPEVHHEMIRS